MTDTSVSSNSKKNLAKIKPKKVNAETLPKKIDQQTVNPKDKKTNEQTLLNACRLFLRHHGIRKSTAAIRDAVEAPHESFGAVQAVSALSQLGFKSGFGSMRVSKITPELFPLIAFDNSGDAIFVNRSLDNGELVVQKDTNKGREEIIKKKDFEKDFNGYIIIASELTSKEKEERNGHWFFSAFLKSKWLYIQVMVAAMVSNFLSLATSLFIMTVYDRVIPNGAFESLFALSIGVVIALLFDFLIRSIRARFIDIASKKADIEISRRLFSRILNFTPLEQRRKTGAMASTIREFESLREFFNSSTLVVLIDLPFILFFIYVIYLIAGPLAYVPLVAVPLVIITGLAIQPILARVTRRSMNSGMNKQAVLVETLTGLETVTATGSGKLMQKRYEEALINQTESGNKIRALSMFIINFATSIQQFAQVAAVIFGVYLIIEGSITQGALIGAVILGGRTMGPLGQMANTLAKLNDAISAYRNLGKLIGGKISFNEFSSPISRPQLIGEIEFKNVSFKFEGTSQPTLSNISFKISPGQKVALVGKMGSGKSTLSRLVAGILEPSEGAILIDGVDVRQIDAADIRKNIGIMLQDSWLFSGTVRENIQMGFNEYEDDYILNVCKIAGVDDFVGSHPKGYDLEIQERGIGLSGGQRQTINLARSLLHDPSILLLDEPTSSMDQATEKKVVESLKSISKQKTMMIVTHRNPILTMVDRVFVLENGKIVADQTPEQLGIKKVS